MLLQFSKLILFSFRKCGWLSVEGEMRRQASLLWLLSDYYKFDETSCLLSVYIRVTNQIKRQTQVEFLSCSVPYFFLLLNVVPQYQVKKAQCCPSCTDSTGFSVYELLLCWLRVWSYETFIVFAKFCTSLIISITTTKS